MYRMLIFVCAAAAVTLGTGAKAAPEAASATDAAVNANAAVDGSSPLSAGSIVKDSRGATVGKVERVLTATAGDRVVLRIGKELISVPASSLDASGKFVTTIRSKAELRAMANAAGS